MSHPQLLDRIRTALEDFLPHPPPLPDNQVSVIPSVLRPALRPDSVFGPSYADPEETMKVLEATTTSMSARRALKTILAIEQEDPSLLCSRPLVGDYSLEELKEHAVLYRVFCKSWPPPTVEEPPDYARLALYSVGALALAALIIFGLSKLLGFRLKLRATKIDDPREACPEHKMPDDQVWPALVANKLQEVITNLEDRDSIYLGHVPQHVAHLLAQYLAWGGQRHISCVPWAVIKLFHETTCVQENSAPTPRLKIVSGDGTPLSQGLLRGPLPKALSSVVQDFVQAFPEPWFAVQETTTAPTSAPAVVEASVQEAATPESSGSETPLSTDDAPTPKTVTRPGPDAIDAPARETVTSPGPDAIDAPDQETVFVPEPATESTAPTADDALAQETVTSPGPESTPADDTLAQETVASSEPAVGSERVPAIIDVLAKETTIKSTKAGTTLVVDISAIEKPQGHSMLTLRETELEKKVREIIREHDVDRFIRDALYEDNGALRLQQPHEVAIEGYAFEQLIRKLKGTWCRVEKLVLWRIGTKIATRRVYRDNLLLWLAFREQAMERDESVEDRRVHPELPCTAVPLRPFCPTYGVIQEDIDRAIQDLQALDRMTAEQQQQVFFAEQKNVLASARIELLRRESKRATTWNQHLVSFSWNCIIVQRREYDQQRLDFVEKHKEQLCMGDTDELSPRIIPRSQITSKLRRPRSDKITCAVIEAFKVAQSPSERRDLFESLKCAFDSRPDDPKIYQSLMETRRNNLSAGSESRDYGLSDQEKLEQQRKDSDYAPENAETLLLTMLKKYGN